MKPFGRMKKISGGNSWKRDYDLHEKGRKLLNWWEDIANRITRTSMKRLLNIEVEKEIQDQDE
jgi:hypothetical protein